MPFDPRSKQDKQGDPEERQEVAHVPKRQGGHQKATVKHDPGARIEGLDEGMFTFAITPGDEHTHLPIFGNTRKNIDTKIVAEMMPGPAIGINSLTTALLIL